MSEQSIIYVSAIPEEFFNKELLSRTADILCIEGKFDKDCVFRYLESKNLHKSVEAFVRTSMIQKWALTFNDKSALEELSKLSPFSSEGSRYSVSPHQGAQYALRIHRLPPRIPDTLVAHALKEYVDKVVKITREKVDYKRRKPRVVRNVLVEMNWFQLCKLPHRIEVQTHECLITLRDRESMCLYCKHIGHIRRQCPYERDRGPFLIPIESPDHPNTTIYVTKDSPLARRAAKTHKMGARSSPNGARKPRSKTQVPASNTPNVEDKDPKESAPDVLGKVRKLFRAKDNPFSVWPLFGAFVEPTRKRRIDLRWSLPRHFALSL